MPELLIPYLVLVTLLTITPGPDMLLVLRNGSRGGVSVAWATGVGCCTGIGIHAVAAVAGLSAIIAASSEAFTVIKLAGAAYLVWLGLSSIYTSLTGRTVDPVDQPRERSPLSRSVAFRQGLISNLLNPKIAILFLTLLPQFIATGEPRIGTTVILALSFLAVGLTWMRLISLATGPIQRLLADQRVSIWFSRLTGTLLVAVGVRVGLEER